MTGSEASLLNDQLNLQRDLTKYAYLTNEWNNTSQTDLINDADDKQKFSLMLDGLRACDFSSEQQIDLMKIIAAILHLGNVKFKIDLKSSKDVKKRQHLTHNLDLIVVDDDPFSIYSLESFCKVYMGFLVLFEWWKCEKIRKKF